MRMVCDSLSDLLSGLLKPCIDSIDQMATFFFFFLVNVFSSEYGYVLGYRNQMERGTHSSLLAWWTTVHGITESQIQLGN